MTEPAGNPDDGNNQRDRLIELYATGALGWREFRRSTGLAFGEVLVELGKRGLALPQVTPERRPEQDALLERVLRCPQ